jgi:hypothetical protein
MSQTKNLVAAVLAALTLAAAPVAGLAFSNLGNAVPVACSGGSGSGGGCTV